MDETPPIRPSARRKKPRILLKAFGALALLAVVLVASLPWVLGTAPGQSLIVGQVNGKLAPGSIALEGLSVSWAGPIELTGVSLLDPKGKVVLGAQSVRLDRGVLGLLASGSDYGTITVEGATVDVERRGDGSIDALEALGSAMRSDKPGETSGPGPTVSVVIKGGTLKLASPELVEPVAAARVDGSLTMAPGKPMEVEATISDEGRSLELHATIDHRASGDSAGDNHLAVVSKAWPIHIRQGGVEARGHLEGTIEARRDHGLWALKGDAAILGFEAFGPALAGDRLAFDRVGAECDAGQSEGGWTIRKLELISPVASIKGQGSFPSSEPAKLHGQVDLVALAKLIPRAIRLKEGLTLEKGSATLDLELTSIQGTDRFELSASLNDLAALEGTRSLTLREPAHLSGSASQSGGKFAVEKVTVKAAGVDLTGHGDLEAGIKLQGTVDLAALDAQARDLLDLGGLAFSGHARLGAEYRRDLEEFKARFAVECKDLDIAGLTAAPIVRELARVDGVASGPRSADGIPNGWREVHLDVRSADLLVDLDATHQGDEIELKASTGFDVASPTPGRLDAKADLVMKGRVFEVQELRAGIIPAGPASGPGSVAIAVQGKLDLASGEGLFTPIAGSTLGAVGLLPEGIKVVGLGRGDAPLRLDAAMQGDLGTVDRLLAAWSGSPPKGLGGRWETHFKASRSVAGKLESDGQVDIPEIIAPGLKGLFSLAWKGGYSPEGDRLEVVGLNLTTQYGKLAMAGNLYEVKARRIYDVIASFEPDWAAIDPILAASLEPGAKFRASVRPVHWKGFLKADTTDQLLAQQITEIGLDVTQARAFGVTLDPMPVVLKIGEGNALFDPIDTKANGGPVHVLANLALDADRGLWLRLLPGTKVDGAAINDDVSTAVLAYVAPVLAQATQVSGKVSAEIGPAMLPITATGQSTMQGQLSFIDVTFISGPLGNELASMVGQPSPKLVLQESMKIDVSGGRVKQTGLSIPLPGIAKVGLDGSVGFDKTLDLRASVPLTARMLGLDPKFDKSVGNTRLSIPIRGTMARPAIDRKALAVALRDAAKTAVGDGLKSEATGFLDRIAGPNPPTASPKASPARPTRCPSWRTWDERSSPEEALKPS